MMTLSTIEQSLNELLLNSDFGSVETLNEKPSVSAEGISKKISDLERSLKDGKLNSSILTETPDLCKQKGVSMSNLHSPDQELDTFFRAEMDCPISNFTMIPNIVYEMVGKGLISSHAFILYIAYMRTCGQEGSCWKSVRTLAKEAGISQASISDARKELEQNFEILGGRPLIKVKHNSKKSQKSDVVVIVNVWKENHTFFNKKVTCSPIEHPCSPIEHPCSPIEHKNIYIKNIHMKNILEESKDSSFADAKKAESKNPDEETKKEPKLAIDKKTFKIKNLTPELYEELKKIAPSIDLFAEIERIEEWLQNNQTSAKEKKDIKRFLTKWLKKEEEKFKWQEKQAKKREIEKKYSKKGGNKTENTNYQPFRTLSKEEEEYKSRMEKTVYRIGDPEKVEQEWRERMQNGIVNLDELKKKEAEKKANH